MLYAIVTIFEDFCFQKPENLWQNIIFGNSLGKADENWSAKKKKTGQNCFQNVCHRSLGILNLTRQEKMAHLMLIEFPH